MASGGVEQSKGLIGRAVGGVCVWGWGGGGRQRQRICPSSAGSEELLQVDSSNTAPQLRN